MARTTDLGRRFAMGHRTEGSSYEAPTRWLADVAISMKTHVHAVERGRILCARALDYPLDLEEHYGLQAAAQEPAPHAKSGDVGPEAATVVFAHGSSRADKQWPVANWVDLGRRFNQSGLQVAFPHGNQAELQSSHQMAGQLQLAQVWPRLSLDELADAMARCVGVIGVDSGLSHVAVALDLPHVQLYNLDTAWRTGPVDRPRQRSLYASPFPTVDAVWQAWQALVRA
jgi:heptosyltransferase-1